MNPRCGAKFAVRPARRSSEGVRVLAIVQVLAAAAALVHLVIFVLESVRFADPKVHEQTFRVAAGRPARGAEMGLQSGLL